MKSFTHKTIEKIAKWLINNDSKIALSSSNNKGKSPELIIWESIIKDTFLIVLGILSATFGLKGFLLPNSYIDGGVTGISLLISITTKLHLSALILIINIPFLFLALKQINKALVIRSIISITGLSLSLIFIKVPIITNDKLLTAVFGGFFLGGGIGLAIRGGTVIDGTEILAIYLSKKIGATIGDIIWLINILIFTIAAYFLSIEISLYSILIYLSASKTADFIIDGIEEYIGVTIISEHSDEIRLMIINKLGRGVTLYYGKRGYAMEGENLKKTDVIFSVITRLEIAKLRNEVDKIDPTAFIVMNSIKETKGGVIKKRTIKDN